MWRLYGTSFNDKMLYHELSSPPVFSDVRVTQSLVSITGARGTDLPPPFFKLSVYKFYLFSIKFLYFFIISSLFPYFNLFVSIFIQSYINIKLHVSTLYRY